MKWFKHFTDNSTLNPKLTQLIDTHGVEGYGRYSILLESLIRMSDDAQQAPKVTLTAKRWAEILHLKAKNVLTFLEHLAKLSLIFILRSANEITVELANYLEIISDRAISSQKRGTTGSPRVEERRGEKRKSSLSQKNSQRNQENDSSETTLGSQDNHDYAGTENSSSGSAVQSTDDATNGLPPINLQLAADVLRLVAAC